MSDLLMSDRERELHNQRLFLGINDIEVRLARLEARAIKPWKEPDLPATYTVELNPHGMIVRGDPRCNGALAISDLKKIAPAATGLGYDLADSLLAKHFGVPLVLVNAESMVAWRAELGIEVPDEG